MYDAADLELRENVSERMADQARRDLVPYYGMITSLDDQMERLLAFLEEEGIREETIVVFTSDHGEQIGSQDCYYKSYPYEESVHVPLIWEYPEGLPAGESRTEPTSLIDLMPTLLSMCGADVPEGVQGEDISGVLADGESLDRPGVYIEDNVGDDDEWRAFRTESHLLVVDRYGEEQYFFNTDDDPYQQHDLKDIVHDKQDLERYLVDAAMEYDDRYFLNQIGERPN
jgi:arylsulfatase A-like enzyme